MYAAAIAEALHVCSISNMEVQPSRTGEEAHRSSRCSVFGPASAVSYDD